jgi:radical SAM superfamily enzyme YgiQ (UPF0313 family)
MVGMSRIVLTTLNARYIHCSIGLRALLANLGELRPEAEMVEFVVGDRPPDMAEKLLASGPCILGIGVYIWNAREVADLIRVLKTLAPGLVIVLGGPEVSHDPLREDFSGADYILRGEGEIAFADLCRRLLAGDRPEQRLIVAAPPNLGDLVLPYDFYNEEDVHHRVIYLEASRGCPFGCEFCLSSIDRRVRYFDRERLRSAIDTLWQRGVRHFKFIDRSFNLDMDLATGLLDDFLARQEPFLVHFEMIPDRFPPALKERLRRFPPGSLQLEIGIQTLSPDVAARIGRPLDLAEIEENLAFLSRETAAHLHLDLIFGLPGEGIEGMAHGLDRLVALGRGEIQLGILKKLSGTAIARHDGPFAMVFSPLPPYELLQNDRVSFEQMQELRRLARYWDLCYNSGRFRQTLPLLWPDGRVFDAFMTFSRWLYRELGTTTRIALERLTDQLFRFLTTQRGRDAQRVTQSLLQDLGDAPGRRLPACLRGKSLGKAVPQAGNLPRRQGRHSRGDDRRSD